MHDHIFVTQQFSNHVTQQFSNQAGVCMATALGDIDTPYAAGPTASPSCLPQNELTCTWARLEGEDASGVGDELGQVLDDDRQLLVGAEAAHLLRHQLAEHSNHGEAAVLELLQLLRLEDLRDTTCGRAARDGSAIGVSSSLLAPQPWPVRPLHRIERPW